MADIGSQQVSGRRHARCRRTSVHRRSAEAEHLNEHHNIAHWFNEHFPHKPASTRCCRNIRSVVIQDENIYK